MRRYAISILKSIVYLIIIVFIVYLLMRNMPTHTDVFIIGRG